MIPTTEIHCLGEYSLERRRYWLDIRDESGGKHRVEIHRLVAKLIDEQRGEISRLRTELDEARRAA